jgi:glycosyltransferase involved in cell wall biosynthesis
MRVDVLVTTYRRPGEVLRLLQNLQAQTYRDFGLQIFDGSPDRETAEVIAVFRDEQGSTGYPVRYHRTTAGMTRQRNLAVARTDGDLSLFLDDDVELEPDYLWQVVRVFEEDASGAIAGLNGYDLEAAGSPGLKKRIYRLLGLLPRVGCARYLPWGHPTMLQEGGPFQGARDCDVLIGHNMVWRTAVLKELEFARFFADYPTYVLYDDTDISLRARTRFRLVQCGDARLHHRPAPGGRPPGFHYGFQTVFNAHRNFRVHRPTARALDHVRFWLWEGLGALFLTARGLIQWPHLSVATGMLAGGWAAVRGVPTYAAWQAARRSRREAGGWGA